MKLELRLIVVCIIAGAFFGALAAFLVVNYMPKSQNDMIGEFYSTENAVSVSPTDYINDMKNGKTDGLVVDLRARSDYAAGHLVTAVNIPAGEMNTTQLVAAFNSLPKDKPIITYCYSEYCMLSRKVGKALADNGIYVKHFTAGAYEIKRDLSSYVVNGSSPGIFNNSNQTGGYCSAPGGGTFTC